MAGGLNTLIQALLGGAAGGFKGYAEGQYAKQQKAEREAEQKRIADQFAQQMQLARDQAAELAKERDWDRTNVNYASENPDADLTTSPNLASYERWGKPLTRTAAVSAPKISDSFTLPSLPGSAPSTGIGGAASTPMAAGKYDPNAEEETAPAAPGDIPKPLPMGGPMTVATPTYGLGTPGKVTRTETRQESQQRIAREAQIGTLKSALTTLGKDPLARGILEHSIKALEAGGNANITDNDLLAMQRAGEPPKPPASAQPDFDFMADFKAVAGRNYDESATPQELAAVREFQKKNRGTVSTGGSTTEPSWQTLEVTGPDGKPMTAQVNPKTGEVRPLSLPDGVSVVRAKKPPTGIQSRAHTFFLRAVNADKDLAQVADKIAGLGVGGQLEVNMPSWLNFMKSPEAQQYTQAQRAFTEARLRKDSGAAIPEHEFANDKRMYFEQVGDSPEVRAQKQAARATVLEALAAESGSAYDAYAGQSFTPGQFLNARTGAIHADVEKEITKGVAEGYTREEVIAHLKKIGRIK